MSIKQQVRLQAHSMAFFGMSEFINHTSANTQLSKRAVPTATRVGGNQTIETCGKSAVQRARDRMAKDKEGVPPVAQQQFRVASLAALHAAPSYGDHR